MHRQASGRTFLLVSLHDGFVQDYERLKEMGVRICQRAKGGNLWDCSGI